MREYWDVVGALWNVIDIYAGPNALLRTYNSDPESGLIFAAHHCQCKVALAGLKTVSGIPPELAPEA